MLASINSAGFLVLLAFIILSHTHAVAAECRLSGNYRCPAVKGLFSDDCTEGKILDCKYKTLRGAWKYQCFYKAEGACPQLAVPKSSRECPENCRVVLGDAVDIEMDSYEDIETEWEWDEESVLKVQI